jgi:hypothetical protein
VGRVGAEAPDAGDRRGAGQSGGLLERAQRPTGHDEVEAEHVVAGRGHVVIMGYAAREPCGRRATVEAQQGDASESLLPTEKPLRAALPRSPNAPAAGRVVDPGRWSLPGGREDEVSFATRRGSRVVPRAHHAGEERGDTMNRKLRAWLGKVWGNRRRRTDDAFRRGTSTPA